MLTCVCFFLRLEEAVTFVEPEYLNNTKLFYEPPTGEETVRTQHDLFIGTENSGRTGGNNLEDSDDTATWPQEGLNIN